MRTTVHKVVHILNEKGYDEASGEIALYNEGKNRENLNSFKAVTYNLEDGKIKEAKLGKSDLIKEQIDKEKTLLKFTMPNVKAGSIVEYTYQVVTDYISQPDAWLFQSTTTPTLWSEYRFALPSFFIYNITIRGYRKLDIIDQKNKQSLFTVVEQSTISQNKNIDITATTTHNRWVMKNSPELKTEPFTYSIRNHIPRLEFQLAGQRSPLIPQTYRSTWQEITKGLLESEYFGKNLNTDANWFEPEIKQIIGSASDQLSVANKIYCYVRDEIKSTDEAGVYISHSPKKVFGAKKGSIAEINILLTAMLRYAGLKAVPILLSTSSHGYAAEHLPMISSMNYVVAKVTIGEKEYFLDASQKQLGFGRLAPYCYNGFAVEANMNGTSVHLDPAQLNEKSVTSINLFLNKELNAGNVQKTKGYFASLRDRNTIEKSGTDQYFRGIKNQYTNALDVTDFKIDSLNDLEQPIKVSYNLKFDENTDGIIYLNPYYGENYSKNPFASAERQYPVEFPFPQEEVVLSTIVTPEGYTVDELPKSLSVYLDETKKSYFEYKISASGSNINFLSRLKLSKTFYMPEEYYKLREFFDFVVKKQAEQIVLKKNKS